MTAARDGIDISAAADSSAHRPRFPEPLHVGRPNVGSRERFLELAGEMFDRQWFTNDGPLVQEFEHRIADRAGVAHCVAMCNGTLALEIAIRALGLSGQVIVPSWTFIATAHALNWQGITPVFADIDPTTQNLDPEAVRAMITPQTTGIIAVHLWGRPADVVGLQQVADQHDLKLIYDAAHAFGVTHRGQSIGSFGDAEVLSFHATKFFNTFEGGAVVTNDEELAETMRLMRNFGFKGYDNVIHPGTNGKMPEVCAAMGLANLESVEHVIAVNRRNYRRYRDVISAIPGLSILPYDSADDPNFQYVVMNVGDEFALSRDEVVDLLHRENVLARRYFWPGCHRMLPYRALYPHAGLLLPHTESVAERVVVLPTGPSVAENDIDALGEILAGGATR